MKPHSIDNLFIRMDNIGDLILNLPVDQHPLVSQQNNHWFISKGLGFVLNNSQPRRHYTEFEKSESALEQMVSYLLELKPKRAIVFHAPWWVGKALKQANVPIRMGRLSQWHSYFYFNYGIRQKRSRAEMSERDYNFELLEKCYAKTKVPVPEYDFSEAYTPIFNNDDTNILAELNLMPQSYVVVHPGMRGSALNWPPECYIDFIKQLEKDQTIVITGTDSDWPYIEPLFQEFNQQPHFKWLNGKLSADELIAVLQNAKVVMAPSTGVIHLAASSGVPCVGIYPPIKVQSKKRWGAIGPKAINLEAEENKNLKNPMSGLSPQLVYNSVKQYL